MQSRYFDWKTVEGCCIELARPLISEETHAHTREAFLIRPRQQQRQPAGIQARARARREGGRHPLLRVHPWMRPTFRSRTGFEGGGEGREDRFAQHRCETHTKHTKRQNQQRQQQARTP
ncbi:hypothetical protein MRX96_045619 [Rhipicephalus microplus]